MKFLFLSILFVFSSPLSAFSYECCGQFLEGRISQSDKRYSTFQYVLSLMEERGSSILVETGTARLGNTNCAGDGCSTIIFADWATTHQAKLFSVDIDARAVYQSELAVSQTLKGRNYAKDNIKIVCQDSIAFLANFIGNIDFLYLDSYDFDFGNPNPSQMHHLKEIMAAYPHLTENSIVMIDDCDLPFGGKGKRVIEYLLQQGWKIVASGYQTILVKG